MPSIANTPGFFQRTGTLPGGEQWKPFGWDYIGSASDWSTAGENVRGFACNPQALICAFDVPLLPVFSPNLRQTIFNIPELDVQVSMHEWINPSTRTAWVSLDAIFAVAVGDTTAGCVIKSS